MLAGRKPSDNLLSCISRAAGESGEQRSLLPSELASYLHNIRIVSNKARHDVEAIALTNVHAEIALNQFLTVLEWFYCDYEHQPHRLRSVYVTRAPATALQARKPSLWTVPGSRLPNFIGRDQLLEQLERGFAAEAASARPPGLRRSRVMSGSSVAPRTYRRRARNCHARPETDLGGFKR